MATQPHQTAQLKQQARTLLQAGRLDDARKVCVQACEHDPRDVDGWHLLGAIHRMLGNPAEVVTCARRATELRPNAAITHLGLGNALLDLKDYDTARTALARALTLDPRNADIHNSIGTLHFSLGEYPEAEAAYRRGLALNARHPQIHSNLGSALLMQRKSEAAISHLRRALELDPGNAVSHFNLGKGLEALGRYADALACFQRALQIQPGMMEAKLCSALILSHQLHRPVEALALLQPLRHQFPDNVEILYHIGHTYIILGDREQAITTLHEVLNREPNHREAHFHLATLGVGETPARLDREVIVRIFDGCADFFDQRLVNELGYHTPVDLRDFLAPKLGEPTPRLAILDLGCGTGLCAPLFKPWARSLTGVDLSPRMIEKAREHALYDRLLTEDLMAPLNEPGAAYDLILTTDVFIYLGDLDEVFRACARVLPPGGLFAFSLEAHEGDKPYVLNTTGRYAHSLDYIRQLGTKYGLHLVRHESCTLRKEHGQPVAGTLCLMVPSSGIAEA